MTLPPKYTGAWRRESISLGGAPASEPQQVWWLQTPSYFADLRLPLVPQAGAESFSGITTLSAGPRLTWHRDLDLHDAGTGILDPADLDADSGEVSWQDGALIEDGVATVFGAPVRYREVWRRMPGSNGPFISLRPASGQGRLIIIGDYALAILIRPEPGDGLVSAAWQRRSGTWELSGCWPARPGSPPAPPAVLALSDLSADDTAAEWQIEFRGRL